MPSAERTVKIILRWSMPLFILAALGGHVTDGLVGASRIWTAPRPTAVSDSPDKRYRALVFNPHEPSDNGTQVVLQHHFHWLFLGGFTSLTANRPAQIELTWNGPSSLLIRCDRCERATTDLAETNWGKLHLSYDLEASAT